MRIRHFLLLGIRGLDGFKADLPRASDVDLIVVHGGYASGKTTCLDTLAAAKESIAAYGSSDSRWAALTSARTGSAKVRIDWEASDAERSRLGLSDPLLSSEAILGKALAPPQHSKVLQGLLAQRGDRERGSIHYLHDGRHLSSALSYGAAEASLKERLTTRNAKFSDLYDLLDQPDRGAARAVGVSRFSELFPELEITGLRRTGFSFVPTIRHREEGTERAYEELSSSERNAFLAALYTAKAPIVDSVILVDAPELGFGDDGATDLVRALLRWTSNTQLIVATSSHAVRSMPEVAHVVELPS